MIDRPMGARVNLKFNHSPNSGGGRGGGRRARTVKVIERRREETPEESLSRFSVLSKVPCGWCRKQ